MKRLMRVSMHAVLLLSVVFLASCGGDDDGPTGAEGGGDGEGVAGGGPGRLDSRLYGTWITQEVWFGEQVFYEAIEDLASSMTLKDDGSVVWRMQEGIENLAWWTEGEQLFVATVSVFSYAIQDGKLTFSAVGEVYFDPGEFMADGNPSGLTGVTWVDEEGDELVFSSDGEYRWEGIGSSSGIWTSEGRTITIYSHYEGHDYEVTGATLTIFVESRENRWILTKQ